MGKLDPALKRLASAVRPPAATPVPVTAAAAVAAAAPPPPPPPPAAPERTNVIIEFDGKLADLERIEFKVRTRAGNIFTGDIPTKRLGMLDGLEGFKRAESSRRLSPDLEDALPAANIVGTRAFSGKFDPIIGIIDSGINYQHQSFRNAKGGTRLLAIWDQGIKPETKGEKSPAVFGYGVEFRRPDIDAALATKAPLDKVRHDDRAPFHGTHVAGIAAGDGLVMPGSDATVRFAGVAPNADIIVVANTRKDPLEARGLGESADTLDAVHYILKKAGKRPVVINQSQGDNIGPHDGSSLLERGIDALISGPGRVMVKSAGNEGARSCHAEGTLDGVVAQMVEFEVHPDAAEDIPPAEVIIDLWYPRKHRIGVNIVPPSETGVRDSVIEAPSTTNIALVNGNSAFVDSDLDDPGNGDNRIYIVLTHGREKAVEAGKWSLTLSGTGPWHAWIQRTSPAHFLCDFATPNTTISIPGTSRSVITVGSYVSNGLFTGSTTGALSNFSSRGPARDVRDIPIPTLCAPGEELTSAQPGDHLVGPRRGTSMSAPMVTGAIARLLAVRPTMTAEEVRTCLVESARADVHTGPVPNADWGAGKLDVEAALKKLRTSRKAKLTRRKVVPARRRT